MLSISIEKEFLSRMTLEATSHRPSIKSCYTVLESLEFSARGNCLIQRGRRKDGTTYRRYNWDKTLIRVSRHG